MLPSDSFDITLVLGPMYHLHNLEDKKQAIAEALRITKPNGVIFVAYCISDATIFEDGFMRRRLNVAEYIRLGKIDSKTFAVNFSAKDIFELVRKEDIDQLMMTFTNTKRLHYVATDLFSRYIRESIDEMDEETFDLYLNYHLAVCERGDMVGLSHHTLDIFRKEV